MSDLMSITLVGTIAGVFGTGLGGILGVMIGTPSRKYLGLIMGFSGGLMISIVFFGLVPQALELADMIYCLLGISFGSFLISALDMLTPLQLDRDGSGNSRYKKVGLLLGIGIALHNLPEGLAIGAGFISAEQYGLSLALVFSLHNGPEGMAMTIPLRIAGYSPLRVIMITAATGIPMGLGTFIGHLLGFIAPQFISICLGFAAGAMLYITVGEIIPDSLEMGGPGKGLAKYGIMAGIVLGIILSMFV